MSTKMHFLLALGLCFFCAAGIVKNSLQLIGLLHGPSEEVKALEQHQSQQTQIIALATQNNYPWPWGDAETTDQVFASYNDVAYLDHGAAILRDAGIIGALFAMILGLVTNFMSVSYSSNKRLTFLLLAPSLYIAPGLVGQLVFQRTIPIEIALLKTWGVAKGLAYIGYCSERSLLIGLGDGPSTYVTIIHDLKVAATSCLLVSIILGLQKK